MTDFDFVAEGKGVVVLRTNEQGDAVDGIDSDHIIVMASGLVLCTLDDGAVHTSFGTPVLINEPTWSVLEINKEPDAPPPNCDRCQDDPTNRAKMVPPVCPKCGGKA